jgi:endo-1,4-beta-xylanase
MLVRSKVVRTSALAIVWLCGLMVHQNEAAVIVLNDFEDGTTQSWVPRGDGVTLTNVTEAAQSGLRSLKTTGRTATWQGPSLDVMALLQRDTVYQIKASVRLVSGQSPCTVKLTMERMVAGETSPNYDTVVSSASDGVTDAGWVTLQGSYRYSTDVSRLLLYVESSIDVSEYYLDDVQIAELVPDQSGIESKFEDGTTLGYTTQDGVDRYWFGRGSGVIVSNVTEDAYEGSHSLLTTVRTSTWQGPSLDILGKITKGFRYRITVWVKLAPDQEATNLKVSVQRSLGGGSPNYDNVTPSTLVTASEWVKLSALYTMPADADSLYVYVESSSATASFYIDDFSLIFTPPPPIQTDIPSLRDVLAGDFLIGGAIEPGQTGSPLHAELMIKHLSSLTAENAMKCGSIHKEEAAYSFSGADTIADFARANGMTMRGHALVWHSQNPDWLFKDAQGNDLAPTPESKELMLQRLEDHIRTVVARYDDVVSSWDVVNEVIDSNQPDGLRRSKWYELVGPEYIDRAFEVARETTSPGVKLCINDYSTTNPAKRQALAYVVQDLIARGIPVDCVGHQMHVNVEQPSITDFRATLQTFADLGMDNQITEMDVSVYTNDTDSFTTIPEELLVLQGHRYRDIFDVFREFRDSISSVTLWGIADDHTWLKSFPIKRLDLPLLFDEDLQAKHAYWGVVDPAKLPVLIRKLEVTGGTPRIDGRSDLRWKAINAVAFSAIEESSLTAKFKLMWDDGRLYVLVNVRDRTPDWSDAVEIFIDENNDKTPTYGADDAHYSFRRLGFGRHCRWSRILPLPGYGYRLEAAIPLLSANTLGREIGFDIRVRDGRAPGALISWNDTTHSQDSDTSKFGVLRLVEAYDIAKAVWGTPQIDGVLDPIWARAQELTTATWVLGTSGSTARVKTLWDRDHLYVFAHVTDSLLSQVAANPWEQDSVEIFLDQNNGKTKSYEADDGQYRVNYENVQSFGGSASASKFVTATQVVPDGYVVEAAITLDAIQARPGTLVGFDFQVNNDELGDGVRSSVVTWSDPSGDSYKNTSKFGVLHLVVW